MFNFLFDKKDCNLDERIEKILKATEAFYAQLDHDYKLIDKTKADLTDMSRYDVTRAYELLLMDINVESDEFYYYHAFELDRGLMRSRYYDMSVWGYRVKAKSKQFNPRRDWKEVLKSAIKTSDELRPY